MWPPVLESLLLFISILFHAVEIRMWCFKWYSPDDLLKTVVPKFLLLHMPFSAGKKAVQVNFGGKMIGMSLEEGELTCMFNSSHFPAV